jgi:hypothetical protein
MAAGSITDEMIVSGRTRLTIADIRTVMMWPDNEAKRKYFIKAKDAAQFEEFVLNRFGIGEGGKLIRLTSDKYSTW